jgi:putative nucleotidyltransferase with HDIG domain
MGVENKIIELERRIQELTRELASTRQELALYQEVSAEIDSIFDLEKIAKLVLARAGQICGTTQGCFILVDKETKKLSVIPQIKAREFGDEIGEKLVRTKGATIINVPESFPEKKDGLQSLMAVPLETGHETLGEMILYDRPGGFTSTDLELVLILAQQAAVAIKNAKLYNELRESLWTIVKTLAVAVDTKDPYTYGHSSTVANYAVVIAEQMNLPPEEVEAIRLAGLFHDIGKIGIPDGILHKVEPLTNGDWKMIKEHPAAGTRIMAGHKGLRKILSGVYHHHERVDGKGYPEGLQGEKIPLSARILAVADAFEAMTSNRSYRKRISDEEALQKLIEASGTQFDKGVVEAFYTAYRQGKITKAKEYF